MSTIPRCQAEDPASCTDERCPQRLYQVQQIHTAVKAGSFEAFASAKESVKPSFMKVKLPSDFKKVIKELHPNVHLTLSGDGRDGSFVTLNLIRVAKEEQGLGLATKIMGELIEAADKNNWNLALSPDGSFGSSKVRLEVFYRRFGFRPNKGRTRDFNTWETMVRYPVA